MKLSLCFILPLVALCASCRSTQKPYDQLPAAADQPTLITTTTRFVTRCPYCGTPTLSQTILFNGGTSTNGMTLQDLTINYTCPKCLMLFTDHRQQFLPPVRSVQLPMQ